MPELGLRARRRRRLLSVLKLVLPLSALGLLSMVFLLASPIDPMQAIESAPIDVTERARDPRLSAARFAGVNDDGAAITLEAGEARSDPGAALRFQVNDLALSLTDQAGERMTARGASGLIDRASGEYVMEGDVALEASAGYRISAPRLDGRLDSTEITITGPVAGLAPAGEISAGGLRVTATDAGDGSYRLVFHDGVRLIYTPPE